MYCVYEKSKFSCRGTTHKYEKIQTLGDFYDRKTFLYLSDGAGSYSQQAKTFPRMPRDDEIQSLLVELFRKLSTVTSSASKTIST